MRQLDADDIRDKKRLEQKKRSGNWDGTSENYLRFLNGAEFTKDDVTKTMHDPDSELYQQAHDRVIKWRKENSHGQIGKLTRLSVYTIRRIENEDGAVSGQLLKKVLGYEGKLNEGDPKIDAQWDKYREAQDKLDRIHEEVGNISEIARRVGAEDYEVRGVFNDAYSNPHDVADKILAYEEK